MDDRFLELYIVLNRFLDWALADQLELLLVDGDLPLELCNLLFFKLQVLTQLLGVGRFPSGLGYCGSFLFL